VTDTLGKNQVEFELQEGTPLICRTDADGLVSMTTRVGRAATWFLLEKYGDKIFDGRGGSGRS